MPKRREITNALLAYPEDIFKTKIRLRISKFNEIKAFRLPECPVYMRLFSIGSYSQSWADKISTPVMPLFIFVVVRNIFAIRNAIPSAR